MSNHIFSSLVLLKLFNLRITVVKLLYQFPYTEINKSRLTAGNLIQIHKKETFLP